MLRHEKRDRIKDYLLFILFYQVSILFYMYINVFMFIIRLYFCSCLVALKHLLVPDAKGSFSVSGIKWGCVCLL